MTRAITQHINVKRGILRGAALAALSAGLAAGGSGAALAQLSEGDDGRCATMLSARIADTQVTGAHIVADEEGLPPYCEVTATVRAVPGSEIGMVYRLPVEWNGHVLGLGGGGWLGNVTLLAARDGLARNYATMQTDAGASGPPFNPESWALNPDGSLNETKFEDFSHRAIHLMTARGKDVAEAFYGRAHDKALYLGCSTGGRMGLMEAQRYPADYDGVIAGAPVYTLQTQTSAALRTQAFTGEGRLRPAHLQLVNRAVMAACDAADGAEDGILRDPRACDFDPRSLICEGEPKDTCLTRAQADALTRIYEGQLTPDGAVAAWPVERGSELGWENQPLATGVRATFLAASENADPYSGSGGLYAFRGPLLGDPDFNMANFTPAMTARVRESWMAETYEAEDPDLGEFAARGGRLILWHGMNDAGPSPRATVTYYEAALSATPGAEDHVRLFLAPGVNHCRGGPGPDEVDWLGALESWVLTGAAPEEIPAANAGDGPSWNLCAWPALPTGQADGTYACE